jgi:CRP/FNR family transcriptional regulator, cyclic AMP receptor protein
LDTKLRRAELFDGLDTTAANALARRCKRVKFTCGYTIYCEGEPGDELYVVVSGHVKITRCSPAGDDVVTAILGESDIFGELAVFDPGPRGSSATALTDVKAVALNRAALRGWITAHPNGVETLLALLARRQRRTTEQLADLLFTDVETRLAKQVTQLAQRLGTSDQNGIRVPVELTHNDLAHLVGAPPAAVGRALVDFERRGWIRVDRGRLIVVDAAGLAGRARS